MSAEPSSSGPLACAWKPTRVVRVIRGLTTSTAPVHVATDAGQAYLKTLGNPEGPSALVCEYIGTRLVAWLGLPTLEMAIVPFPSVLPVDYPKSCRALPGPAFATRAVDGRSWSGDTEDLRLIDNPEALSGLVVFDTWTRNCDRYRARRDEIRCNINNVFLSAEGAARGRYRLLAIDQTECFRCGRELSPNLFRIDETRDTTLFGLFPEFIPFITPETLRPFVNRLRTFRAEHTTELMREVPPSGAPYLSPTTRRSGLVLPAGGILPFASTVGSAMNRHAAVYSIIQFCPDVARGEGVNVGVVLICPELNAVRVCMSANNLRVKNHFGAQAFDDARLASAKRTLARRLSLIQPTEADFRVFISREASSFVVQDPRPMAVTNPDADVATLFDDLVGEIQEPKRGSRVSGPDLGAYFGPLFMARVPLQRDVTISVPVLGRSLHAPYAYTNGKINYIKPQGFGENEGETIKRASALGLQGLMLAKHPDGTTPRRLIVVAEFRMPQHGQRVRELFVDCDVRMVMSNELPAFAEEVRREAHA